jgi:hypothetical protein
MLFLSLENQNQNLKTISRSFLSPLALLSALDHFSRCEPLEVCMGILLGNKENMDQVLLEADFLLMPPEGQGKKILEFGNWKSFR